ncbi:LacI family DNA-binding transcriptional regulator [Pseudoduganella sp. RAF19]|uniref:LacI family DNA-binding transcriptional regulator n=1 Tax=Pseudoduganella sp. RAF19 TaxID=3233052 RepID=UPI003F9E0C04
MKTEKPEIRLLNSSAETVPAGGPTLVDVARVAGVSAITVSRALNQPQLVKPNTLAKIQAAIDETGYVKNMLAGGLAMNRSKLVSLVIPNIANPVFADMVQSATATLTAAGYQVLLGLGGYESWREELLVETILSRRPDGVILTGTQHTDNTRNRLQKAGVPVVETWDMTPAPIDMLVGFSHEEAGRVVASHLLERGYRRVGIVTMDDGRAVRRKQGLLVALARHGVEVVASEVLSGVATLPLGRTGAGRLLDAHPELDAIAASSDTLAHGVLIEAASRGIAVPSQLAVMGFGDLSFAAHVYPALSTIRVDGTLIGSTAAKAILQRVDPNSSAPVERVMDVGFELVHRAST